MQLEKLHTLTVNLFEQNLITIQVDGFVSMLLSISLNETITFYQICDDTLVGIHAINPRKFADEFLRLRRQNLIETKATGREKEVLSTFDTGNRFQTVSSRKKKNK